VTVGNSSSMTTALRQRAEDDQYLDFCTPFATISYTWREFWSLAAAYRELIDRELPDSRFVLIVGRNTPAAVACFLGGIAAGRTVSFFPPRHGLQDQAYYRRQQDAALAKVGADGIIVFDSATETVETPGRCRIVRFPLATEIDTAKRSWSQCLHSFIERLEEFDDFAPPLFIQHSSGTTGIKKAVAVSSAQLGAQLHSYWYGVVERTLASEPVVASWLPLYHDMGLVAGLLLPTLAGRRIGFVDAFDWVARPQLFLNLISGCGANICWMPNFAFRHYCRVFPALSRVDLSRMHAWVDCSEPCRTRDAVAFEHRFAPWGVRSTSVVGSYAMAETVFAITQACTRARRTLLVRPDIQPGDVLDFRSLLEGSTPEVTLGNVGAILSSGTPVPGARVKCFVDGHPVPAGTYGEIGVMAPFLFGGYRAMTAAESGIRNDGYYMTGDLGVMLADELFVFGRTKEIIIVNGRNLFVSDIEAALGDVVGIKPGRLVVFGVDNLVTGSEAIIVVAEKDPAVVRPTSELIGQIGHIVSAQFLVGLGNVLLIDGRWLVKSTSGKISRSENKAKYLAMTDAVKEHEAANE
jgi:fatty-acyl-CoA synthase